MSRFLKFAVIGDPVAHSKSPELHRGFFDAEELDGSYEAIQVPAGTAVEALERLGRDGYLGLNVTTPLKEEVLIAATAMDEFVERVGAANTLIAREGCWHAANTDGIGAVQALSAAFGRPPNLHNLRVIVLGTGPTARAAAAALRDEGVDVHIWSRTAERAEATADSLGVCAWEAPLPSGSAHAPLKIDAVVATLPPNPDIPTPLLDLMRRTNIVIDANYGPRATLEKTLGRPVMDGLVMLKAQARASFDRWMREFGEGEI